jgi:hypothetical protein
MKMMRLILVLLCNLLPVLVLSGCQAALVAPVQAVSTPAAEVAAATLEMESAPAVAEAAPVEADAAAELAATPAPALLPTPTPEPTVAPPVVPAEAITAPVAAAEGAPAAVAATAPFTVGNELTIAALLERDIQGSAVTIEQQLENGANYARYLASYIS